MKVKRSRSTTKHRPIRPEKPLNNNGGSYLIESEIFKQEPVNKGSRKRKTIILSTVFSLLLVSAIIGLWLTRPIVDSVHAAQVTSKNTPKLTFKITRSLGLKKSSIKLFDNKKEVATEAIFIKKDSVDVIAPKLSDGVHNITIKVNGVGVFQQTLTIRKKINVDTKAPTLTVKEPKIDEEYSDYLPKGVVAINDNPAKISVSVDEDSVVKVNSNATGFKTISKKSKDLNEAGDITAHLPEGLQTLTITAVDKAKNSSSVTRRVLVDTKGPMLFMPLPRIVTDAALNLSITAKDPHGVSLEVKVDDTKLADENITKTVTKKVVNGEDDGEDDELLPQAASFIVKADDLMQGRHSIQLTATDSLGSKTVIKKMFILDSTEDLGQASGIKIAAKGRDVVQLQEALIANNPSLKNSLASEMSNQVFGSKTVAAVGAFQRERGISDDGVAGSETLAVLTLKIVVNRATKVLTLYRSGSVVKTYGVAVGSSKYPTPAGSFKIQSMQKNPTWTPPDSDWAKDAKPIGPGPDNPLGTRWMAIDGTVGIHGTNNPASIGYSVSHGCIRMKIPDVEELFNIVRLGTPVTIV